MSLGSTISTSSVTPSPNAEPCVPGTLLKGDSGRVYEIEKILSDRRNPLLCVYRARAGSAKYIVKNTNKGQFEYQTKLEKLVASSPNVRTVVDTNRENEIFIYPFLAEDLLQFSQKKMASETRKDVLRSALRGLADLHERDILHSDIKPNNFLVDYEEGSNGDVTVKGVQISDLDDAVIIPPKMWLRGRLCGNQIWRSPESWARSLQNQASDVFSFGIVMIYVMTNKMVFFVEDDQLQAEDSWRYILRRHLSFFADEDGFNGILEHIGEENPFYERIMAFADDFPAENGRMPFEYWKVVDPTFTDLVVKMTRLDPALRITARDALAHSWFSA
ncbi:kinase-like protein [Hypoxylon rubiginosum]|uniref:Kinase-like protein n=1 Tax=Hypoxylon rubiginosum TaxID=110542 RepID=A0ACC0CLU5_9PEZI|nr:kinase-like protein [Hypoxylon rubiginosum]